MSKTHNENILLVPGEAGWEIWSSQSEGGCTLHEASAFDHAGDLTNLPPGNITLFFPIKSFTAVPMRVNSEDDALFPDLAALHAERLGLRPDPMAGQLTDVFVIARETENTTLFSVFLRSPADNELPRRGPKGFDISARAFPVVGDALTLWQEFGRWVFAVFQQGKLVFCQATSVDGPQPDASLAREISLSLMQLGMQGLEVRPAHVMVWSNRETIDTSALNAVFRVQADVCPRPAPVLPVPLSKLLPADVRAARRTAQRRLQMTLAVAAVALVYLGVIGWSGYTLWKTQAETQKLNAQAESIAPDGAAYALHVTKWDELAPAIDLANSPVDILKRIADCIPPNSGLRLKTADISALDIKLMGEAPSLQAANTFSLKLTKTADLANFKWQTPEPNNSTRGWEFVYSGLVPGESQP